MDFSVDSLLAIQMSIQSIVCSFHLNISARRGIHQATVFMYMNQRIQLNLFNEREREEKNEKRMEFEARRQTKEEEKNVYESMKKR